MRRVARSALLVLIFTMPWENMWQVGSAVRISKLAGAAAALVWFVTVVVTGTLRRPRPLHVAILSFATWNLVSLLWSQDPTSTVDQALTYLQLALLVFVLYDTLRTLGDLRAAMQAYVLGSWVTVIGLFAKYLSGGAEEAVRFTTGTFEVNALGFVVGLAIPFAWYLASGQREHARPSIWTVPNLVYIPVAVVAVLLTGSRSALVSLLPGVVYVIVWLFRLGVSRRILAVIVLGSVAFLLSSQPVVPQRTLDRLATTGTAVTSSSFGGRADTWEFAFQTFQAHPLIGIGSGAFRTPGVEKAAHNVALRFLAEIGLIGFLLFLAVLVLTVLDIRGQPRMLAGLWISLMMMWAIGASVHNFEDRKQTWFVFAMIAVGAGLQRRDRPRASMELVRSDGSFEHV
jgi:O-antigen ligase